MASVRRQPRAKTRTPQARPWLRPATLAAPAVVIAALLLSGCDDYVQSASARPVKAPGDAARGAELLNRYGCGGCHEIPGIVDATGLVGPPLTKMGRRTIIAGVLHNSPETMRAWIMDPQRFVPGNAMPNLNVSRQNARDMTAYLYTLR
jgi:cytochrome c